MTREYDIEVGMIDGRGTGKIVTIRAAGNTRKAALRQARTWFRMTYPKALWLRHHRITYVPPEQR
jgi:hypothetical protein